MVEERVGVMKGTAGFRALNCREFGRLVAKRKSQVVMRDEKCVSCVEFGCSSVR